ncbi:unnamed protein product [Calypogeia fissa]
MDDEFVLVEPSISDADFEDIQRALWDSEDDVVFSPAFSVVEHLYSSVFDISEHDESFADCAAGISMDISTSRIFSVSVSHPPLDGPSFASPYEHGHLPVREFQERLILSQVLCSFSPALCWLPRGMLLEALLDFFGPILWASAACPCACFCCQLIWYRRLQWIRWAYG